MRAGSSEELGGSYASGCYGAARGSLLPAGILNRAWVGHSDYGGYYHQPTYSRKKGAWATRPAVGGYGLWRANAQPMVSRCRLPRNTLPLPCLTVSASGRSVRNSSSI